MDALRKRALDHTITAARPLERPEFLQYQDNNGARRCCGCVAIVQVSGMLRPIPAGIFNADTLRHCHERGCSPNVRCDVWLLALGVYAPHSTTAQVRVQQSHAEACSLQWHARSRLRGRAQRAAALAGAKLDYTRGLRSVATNALLDRLPAWLRYVAPVAGLACTAGRHETPCADSTVRFAGARTRAGTRRCARLSWTLAVHRAAPAHTPERTSRTFWLCTRSTTDMSTRRCAARLQVVAKSACSRARVHLSTSLFRLGLSTAQTRLQDAAITEHKGGVAGDVGPGGAVSRGLL